MFAFFCTIRLESTCNILYQSDRESGQCPHNKRNSQTCSIFNVNKNPTRCNSMQIFIYCKVTLHVSGVTAPIIRSTKNCNRNLRYRSQYWYSYSPPTWPDQAPDDGCCDTRNMYSDFAVNKYLHTVASGWIFINLWGYLGSRKTFWRRLRLHFQGSPVC